MTEHNEIPLLPLWTLLQSVVLSCRDRKSFPYTRTQLAIFSALEMEGSMSMKQVADAIAASREQATRAVSPLVRDGMLERHLDPKKRTRVIVRMTPKGEDFIRENRIRFYNRIREKVRDSLSEEELEQLRQSARTMTDLLMKVES